MASKFVWYELMTSDLQGRGRLLQEGRGLDLGDMAGRKALYDLEGRRRRRRRMMTLPKEAAKMGQPPAWAGYIYSADTDKQADAIRNAGGQVYYGPADIP